MNRQIDQEAVTLANDVLRLTKITQMPVDIERVAQCYAIKIRTRTLPSPIRAMCHPEARIIILNTRRDHDQRRWDFGHELFEIITLGLGCPHDSGANQFASHLLVPLWDLQTRMGMGFFELTEYYKVSDNVLGYQMALLKKNRVPIRPELLWQAPSNKN
jgi:Zn-dependent peptidase ImmA (M78 family)